MRFVLLPGMLRSNILLNTSDVAFVKAHEWLKASRLLGVDKSGACF